MEKQQIHISLNKEVFNALNAISEQINIPRSQIINEAIEEYLEDLILAERAKQVLQDIEEGKTETITHAEMKKRLGWD